MKLSIIVPGIRPKNWQRLYASVNVPEFEMIFIGPYAPPENMKQTKYIHSFRSPCACQQIGLHYAQGEYVCVGADDGFFLPGALQYALDMTEERTVIVGKYLEGESPENMESEDYYKFKYHKAYRLKGVPQECLIFNCGVISKKFLMELGGWDCIFEATTCAHADLGIRAYEAGAEIVLQDKVMFSCSHQPGKTGDHKPVHEAMQRDLKTFKKLWSKPRQQVELENWKNTPIRWKERFK